MSVLFIYLFLIYFVLSFDIKVRKYAKIKMKKKQTVDEEHQDVQQHENNDLHLITSQQTF